MTLSLRLDGVQDAIKNIRKVNEKVNNEEMSDSAIKALEPVADAARNLAPVLSGELRDSISISDLAVGAVVRQGLAVYVGPIAAQAAYALFVEFGTVDTRAQPFLAPAIDANEDLVFSVLGDDMGRKIESAV